MTTPATPIPEAAPGRARSLAWIGVAVLLLGLAAVLVRLAWLSDDAFITFRCVENMVDGFGPVWNADERVQAFTHPLWFWLLCGLRLVTGELPLSTMWLSIAMSLAAVVWMLRLCADTGSRVVLLLVLLSCRGWLDYTTSGLENPLSYLLLVALVAAMRCERPARRLLAVAVVTGLLASTRLDLVLFGAPVCLVSLRGVPRAAVVRAFVLGMLPLALWSAFAAIYYGSPFPITAYAKAFSHGVSAGHLVERGVAFVTVHVVEDPGMLAVIVLGLVAGLVTPGRRVLAIGMLLYLAYVGKVGGGYMLGRFLTPMATVGAVVLVDVAARRGRAVLLLAGAAVVVAGAVRGWPGYLRSIDHDVKSALTIREDGLCDERRYYFAMNGLLSPVRFVLTPGFHSAGMRRNGDTARRIDVLGMVGMIGFLNGDLIHIVDPWLLDPLLMRLPIGDPDEWRIGHFYRRIPAGYLESVATGENRIAHPGLAKVYEAVRSAVRDPIWSAARWRHLWTLWTGGLRDELAAYVTEQYRQPSRLVLPLADFTGPLAADTPWFRHAPARSCAEGGIAVQLPEAIDAAAVVLHLGGAADYRLELRRGASTVHTALLRVDAQALDGMQPRRVEVPVAAGAIDEIWLTSASPIAQPTAPFLGRVELLPR